VLLGDIARLAARPAAAWAAAFSLLAVVYASLWPSLRGNARFADLVRTLPPAYRGLIGTAGATDLGTATGFLSAELYAVTGPLLVAVLATGLGSAAVAGAEQSGLLEAALAGPVSRTRWVAEQALALAAQVVMVVGVGSLVLVLARPVGDLPVAADRIAAAGVHLAALGVAVGWLALAAGAATGSPAAARGSALLVVLGGYLIQALAPVVPAVRGWRAVSVFHWYGGRAPLLTGVHAGDLIVLLGTGCLLVAVATVRFTRRDLRA
jgi:ABC-2 type transport system permease protein